MKKRDMKAMFKDIQKFTTGSMGQKEKRIATGGPGKVNMPYKMFSGMKKKSLDRFSTQKKEDRQHGIIGDSSREKKLMQSYFEKKEVKKQEEVRLNKGTERGINFHLHSAGKFKNGVLNLQKDALKKLFGDDERKEQPHKRKDRTFEQIQKVREENPEYMTGKRFRKKRGGSGKFKKGGKKKAGKKH